MATSADIVATLPAGKAAAIHITNIPAKATDDDVMALFTDYTTDIASYYVGRDRKKHNECRGYAYVYFTAFGPRLVEALKKLDQRHVLGQTLRMKLADANAASRVTVTDGGAPAESTVTESAVPVPSSGAVSALSAAGVSNKAVQATSTASTPLSATSPASSNAVAGAAPAKNPGALKFTPRTLLGKRPRIEKE
jgi:hypothetical protein